MDDSDWMILAAYKSAHKNGGVVSREIHRNISIANKGKIVDKILSFQYGNALVKFKGETTEMAVWRKISIIHEADLDNKKTLLGASNKTKNEMMYTLLTLT